MAVVKQGRSGGKARRAGNPPRTRRGTGNRAPDNVRKAKPANSKPKTQEKTTAGTPHLLPSPTNETWAIHVSRAALNDISRRLQVAVATATACRAALMAEKADTNEDIILTLQWAVIEVIRRQISRLKVIASSDVKKGHIVAVVAP